MDKHLKNPIPIDKQLKSITHALGFVSFGGGLISIFIPLLLLNAGLPLYGIAVFYVIYSITKLSINFLILKFTIINGPALSLTLSFIANAMQIIGLLLFQETNIYYLVGFSAVMLAFANAFSWNAQHIYISQNINLKTKSSNVASIDILLSAIAISAPLVGAFIVSFIGGVYIYIFSALMFMLALIPLRKMRHYQQKGNHSGIKFNLKGASKRDILANFSLNTEVSVSSQMWPVFLAIAVGTYKQIGLIAAFGALSMFIVTKIAGRMGDKGHNPRILNQGSALVASVDVLRIFASTPLLITFVNAAYQSSLGYLKNAYSSTYYHHAKNQGPQFIASMEIACDIAYLFIWATFLMLLTATNLSTLTVFSIMFIIAAIGALNISRITPDSKNNI